MDAERRVLDKRTCCGDGSDSEQRPNCGIGQSPPFFVREEGAGESNLGFSGEARRRPRSQVSGCPERQNRIDVRPREPHKMHGTPARVAPLPLTWSQSCSCAREGECVG